MKSLLTFYLWNVQNCQSFWLLLPLRLSFSPCGCCSGFLPPLLSSILLLNVAKLAKFNFVVVCPRESIFPWYSLQLRSICLVSVCMYVYIYKLTFYLWNVQNCQSKCTCKFPILKNRGKFAAPPITTTKFS